MSYGCGPLSPVVCRNALDILVELASVFAMGCQILVYPLFWLAILGSGNRKEQGFIQIMEFRLFRGSQSNFPGSSKLGNYQRGDRWELGKEDGCLEQTGQGELCGEEGTAWHDCGGGEKKTFSAEGSRLVLVFSVTLLLTSEEHPPSLMSSVVVPKETVLAIIEGLFTSALHAESTALKPTGSIFAAV